MNPAAGVRPERRGDGCGPVLNISIVTAVLNRVDTVSQALKSVASQSWPKVEHIVIDGGSTDGTQEVLKSHRDTLAVLLSEPDDGIYEALNKGLALATGDLVGVMHSDDFYANNRVLEMVVAAFEDPAVEGVYGDLDYVDKDEPTRVIRHWHAGGYAAAKLPWGWMPPHPTLFLRRSVVERWGGFDMAYRIAADYEAMLRYLTKGRIRLAYIPKVLVKMRIGGESNRSVARILQKSREDYRALRTHEVGGLGTLLCKNCRKLPQFFG